MKKIMLVFGLLIVTSISAQADRRYYAWTYQYVTLPSGQTELEFYQTTKFRDIDEWEYRVEVEQGLTDRFDFSVYQIFKQVEGQPITWDAVQFRIRYRFAEQGLYFVDPLFYLEYNRKTDSHKPNKLESKIILANTLGKTNISINPVYELFFAPDVLHEIGMDIGIAHQFHPRFFAGAESVTRVEFEDGNTETASYIGPTISFASGRWWYTGGTLFGLNDESDDVRVRFLMGIGL